MLKFSSMNEEHLQLDQDIPAEQPKRPKLDAKLIAIFTSLLLAIILGAAFYYSYNKRLINNTSGESMNEGFTKTPSTSDSSTNGIITFETTNNPSESITPTVSPTPTPTAKNTTPTPSVSVKTTTTPTPTPLPTITGLAQNTTEITRKVYVIVFNPTLQSTQTLVQEKNWNSYQTLNTQFINWTKSTSRNRITYSIVKTDVINGFTQFTDGTSYNETLYKSCLSNSANCIKINGSWAMLDYSNLVSTYNICGLINANTIDEVWLFGGPYFGFYESRLAGPNGYWYNSSPITNTSCNRLVPIMGFSYERGVQEMIEDYGHRFEFTMTKITSLKGGAQYADFSSNKKTSSTAFGIGTVHIPANTSADYKWNDPSIVNSFADEFYSNYESYNKNETATISCSSWDCNGYGYFTWYFSHIPSYTGRDAQGKYNDWWQYFVDPNSVYK